MENYEKLYKEALERAKDLHDNHPLGQPLTWITCEKIFPVLKESDDERIRKGIICGMNALKEQHKETFASIPINDCIAWLEKQGEQKPVDESKPKFNVGDWVQIDGGHVMKILDVKKDALCYKILNWCGNESVRKISDIDSIAHLWTIQDAKYGDVLSIEWNQDNDIWEKILIFKALNDNGVEGYGNTFKNNDLFFTDEKVPYYSKTWSKYLCPATKEQRDLLFQKMHEAGYEWDAEKKELKKIEQNNSWSEEDEKMLTSTIEYLNEFKEVYQNGAQECIAWLKSLKDRVQPQPNYVEQDTEIHDLWVYIREWNDKFGRLPKDEDELAACIDYVMKRQKPADKVEQKHAWSEKHIADVFEKVGLARIVRRQGNDKLTNAVQSAMIELSKQQNPAYSEEDRKHIDNIISLLNQTKERFVRESGQFPSWITEILWLESIKDRVQPQLTQEWNEEDEEMYKEVLTDIIYAKNDLKTKRCLELSKRAMKAFNWFSKRYKSLGPQSKWKPSEEQLRAIINSAQGLYQCKEKEVLLDLYEQLKNL